MSLSTLSVRLWRNRYRL